MAPISKEKKKSYAMLIVLLIGFLGVFAFIGPRIYVDSDQYIAMHIHRDPLYPLFLALLRKVFGNGWLIAMGILQNIFAAVTIWLFAEYVGKKFALGFWQKTVVVGFQLIPHIITPMFSLTRVFLASGVLTEGISIPLLMLFFICSFEAFTATDRRTIIKAAAGAWGTALLLALTRGQMMAMIFVWTVVLGLKTLLHKQIFRKKLLYLLVIFLVTASTFGLRSVVVKTYNYAVHGYYINSTNGTVHVLANIIYSSDREDGENITDEEAREWFYRMYDIADSKTANYKYAGETLADKVAHIEEWHDTINFDIVEAELRVHAQSMTHDYIAQDIWADEIAGKIIAGILPECLGQWLVNYMALGVCGLVRNIAIFHPLISWVAIAMYILAIGMFFGGLIHARRKKKKIENAVWFMGLTLLIIFANAFAVSIVIMPISRYMIYGFSLFYSGAWILLIMAIRKWNDRRAAKEQVADR